jgi:hypothetical protein
MAINPEEANLDRQKRQKSRLDPNWQLSEANLAFALEAGLTQPETMREAEKFRKYWLAKAGAKATKYDWNMAWKSWVHTELILRRQRAAPR